VGRPPVPRGPPSHGLLGPISNSAAVNGFLASPLFKTLTGTAVALFVFPNHTSLVAVHEGNIVLYREHPIGYTHVRAAIANQMRIETTLADAVLQDTFVDPVPMIEPVLKALFRQVEISPTISSAAATARFRTTSCAASPPEPSTGPPSFRA
jgi:hypothetical protein